MHCRLLAPLLLLLSLPAMGDVYPDPGRIEFAPQDNDEHSRLRLRVVVSVPQAVSRLVVDRVDHAPGRIAVFATTLHNGLPGQSEADAPVLVEALEPTEYRVELHARSAVRTSHEYTLLDHMDVTFEPEPTLTHDAPTLDDYQHLVFVGEPGCGPVKWMWVDTLPDSRPNMFVPQSWTQTVRLRYAKWPCDEGGSSARIPHWVGLNVGDGPQQAGTYTVRVVSSGETGGGEREDKRVLTYTRGREPAASVAGTWFNPRHPGQGVQVQLLPSGELLASWFTFDDAGNPAVIIAQGLESPLGAVILANGRFPTRDATAGSPRPWGDVALAFHGCGNATLSWTTAYPGFASGSLALQRLSSQKGVECDTRIPSGGRWQWIVPR